MSDSILTPTPSPKTLPAVVAEHRGWFIFLGAALLILGAIAIAFPLLATIATKTFIGWLFLIGGIIQVVHAFSTKTWSEFLLGLLIGALYVIAGAWLAFLPLTGIITLTIFLAVLFVFEGIAEIGIAMRIRPKGGWVWMLVSGIVAIVAGVIIFLGLPGTAAWAIGLLVGINMIFSGMSYLLLALGTKA